MFNLSAVAQVLQLWENHRANYRDLCDVEAKAALEKRAHIECSMGAVQPAVLLRQRRFDWGPPQSLWRMTRQVMRFPTPSPTLGGGLFSWTPRKCNSLEVQFQLVNNPLELAVIETVEEMTTI